MNRTSPHPSRLAFRIRYLRPAPRALAACEALGVETVADFCQRAREDFLAQPNVGERTWRDLSERVERFLDEPGAALDLSADALDRAVAEVLRNRRALRACRQLKIRTIGELLATPRDELLAVPGFGERTLWEVHREVLGASPAEAIADVFPRQLLELPVATLPDDPHARLESFHGMRVAEVLVQSPDVATRTALREGLEAFVNGLLAGRTPEFAEWLRGAREDLGRDNRNVLDRVLGLGRRPSPLAQAASALRIPLAEARERLERARSAMLRYEPAAIELWAKELEANLAALGGVVTPTNLTAGSALRAATRASRDPFLPLRVVTFLRPDVGHTHGDFVCRLDEAAITRVLDALRARIAGTDAALRLADLRSALPEELSPADGDGLLLHLLRHRLHRTLRFDGPSGEVLLRAVRGLADRVEAILETERTPLSTDDLLFHYRDRHGRGRRRRLEDALRGDSRFLQIGRETWSLRSWHLDELELLRPEAERITDEIGRTGSRRDVFTAESGGLPLSERTGHLLIDLLRREPTLRHLGRGDFCPRRVDGSPLVADIVRTLRRAMGEVPFARFLQNQPPSRRRLVSRLLRVNRRFVSPSRDRVDLADNYPVTGERLRMILQVTRQRIDAAGYATLPHVHEAVDEAGLGGDFLSEHLLLDILRRHGDFDVLPGPIVADRRLGLRRWIQRTARAILRAHRDGLTPQQVLADRPELAEFAAALPTLLDLDPLVQSDDGLHYHLV